MILQILLTIVFVLALVVVTTWLSRRHYTVMQDVDRV